METGTGKPGTILQKIACLLLTVCVALEKALCISLSPYFLLSAMAGVGLEDFDKSLQFTLSTSRNLMFCFLIRMFNLQQKQKNPIQVE